MTQTAHLSYQWVAQPPTFLWQAVPFLAIDTEFVWRTTYRPIPALIQIKTPDNVVLVDAPVIKEWQWMADMFASDTLFVLHAAEGDLEIFFQLSRAIPKNIFDTQVAAAFLGMGRSLSLKALVKKCLGITLSKTQSMSDWLKRPLSDAQKRYAAEDVLYLPQLYELLSSQLKKRGLYDFFRQDMQILSNWRPADDRDAYQQVKGSWVLGNEPRAWSILASLAEWREQQARQINCPRKHVLTDEALVWLSQHRPQRLQDLYLCPELSEQQKKRYGRALLTLINASEINYDITPARRLIDIPDGTKLLREMKMCAARQAKAANVPEEVLYNNRLLTGLIQWKAGVRHNPPRQWLGWRSQLLGPHFEALGIPRKPEIRQG